ncbi:hypothetical protein D3C81_1521660 [compost metagenome]
MAEAEGQQGGIAQVEFADAVDQPFLLVKVIDPGVLVLVVDHQAGAHRAFVVQRAGDVNAGAVAIPAAGLGGEGNLRLEGRALADQVDGRRWGAHAVDQAGGAAYHFDAVVGRGALQVVAEQRRGGHAVDGEVADLEAARPELLGVGAEAGADHGDAGGGLQGVADVVELLVVEALAGQHGDRLRGFLGRQVEARGTA